MAKKVPVTSVTPKSTTSKVGAKQAARTRELASWVLPYGKAGKALSTAKRTVGGIIGKGSKSVNPVYKANALKDSGGHVKIKQTEKQRNAALQAEHDKDMASYNKQRSDEMWNAMTSGENFGKKTIKINSKKVSGR